MSGSIVVDIIKNLSLSSSFLSTDRRYEKQDEVYDLTQDKLYSFFLAGGLTLRWQHFDVDLAYVTSTSLSQEWRKQQLARASVGFYLSRYRKYALFKSL